MDKEILLLIIALVVVGFIIAREFFCWYFKITEISNNIVSIAYAISNSNQNSKKYSKEAYIKSEDNVQKEDINELINSLKNKNIELDKLINELESKNIKLEIKIDAMKSNVEDLQNSIEVKNYEDEYEKASTKERQYAFNRIYDDKNNLIGHEWIQVVDKGHWMSFTYDEINRKIIHVKHHRTDSNHSTYINKDEIIRQDKLFNSENIFGFDDKEILRKDGKFYRF